MQTDAVLNRVVSNKIRKFYIFLDVNIFIRYEKAFKYIIRYENFIFFSYPLDKKYFFSFYKILFFKYFNFYDI